jgi:arginine-tRNA-protein transferase
LVYALVNTGIRFTNRPFLFPGFAYYAKSTSLQPKFYQDLLNRGWRRSGTLLYKPDQVAACCPHYTIRLDADSFYASRDQRQAQNRFNKFILGDEYTKEAARLYPKSREQAKKRNTDFDLVERVHESENVNLKTPPEPAHDLKVTLETDNYTDEKYELFENYQRIVHHEPPHKTSKSGFKNFLCNSPLSPCKEKMNGKDRSLGSFHQMYRIDGKLVALGVLDLLPQCVSAVYFMYHESVHHFGLGKLGALREIALAREEGYGWWYAGFYIHSCVKMRYKADYSPQYILDPDTYDWDLMDEEMKRRMDDKTFVSLSRERAKEAFSSRTGTPADLDAEAPLQTTNEATDISESPLGKVSDSDDEPPDPHPNALIWERPMPGLLTRAQLLHEINLDEIKVQIDDEVFETQQLVGWDTSTIDDDLRTAKRVIAELVSAVGVDCGREMILSFK